MDISTATFNDIASRDISTLVNEDDELSLADFCLKAGLTFKGDDERILKILTTTEEIKVTSTDLKLFGYTYSTHSDAKNAFLQLLRAGNFEYTEIADYIVLKNANDIYQIILRGRDLNSIHERLARIQEVLKLFAGYKAQFHKRHALELADNLQEAEERCIHVKINLQHAQATIEDLRQRQDTILNTYIPMIRELEPRMAHAAINPDKEHRLALVSLPAGSVTAGTTVPCWYVARRQTISMRKLTQDMTADHGVSTILDIWDVTHPVNMWNTIRERLRANNVVINGNLIEFSENTLVNLSDEYLLVLFDQVLNEIDVDDIANNMEQLLLR